MPDSIAQPRLAARLTPYELVFGDPLFEDDLFPAVRQEIDARGAWSGDPDAFLLLGSVGAGLRQLAPEASDPKATSEPTDAPRPDAPSSPATQGGERFRQIGLLFFHAWHFWRHGRTLLVVGEHSARALTAQPPHVGRWQLRAPSPAGYLELPHNLFWTRVDEAKAPEPVDGFFWTLVGAEAPERPPYRRLDLMLALGMRPGRAGLSVVEAGAPLPADGHWADVEARPGGEDFANVLPGGDEADLRALVTRAEALRLASILFHAAARPGALGPEHPPAPQEGLPSRHALPASRLPYRRLHPRGDDG